MKTMLDELVRVLAACDRDADNLTTSERVTLHQKIKAVMLALDTPAAAEVAPHLPPQSRKVYIATMRGLLAQTEYLFRPEGGLN
jgi:hypothetical protein